MPARWADTLAPGKPYAETFRGLLIQRIEHDFEAEDDIVQGVIDALLEVDTKQALDAELEPIFDEGYEGISNWCVCQRKNASWPAVGRRHCSTCCSSRVPWHCSPTHCVLPMCCVGAGLPWSSIHLSRPSPRSQRRQTAPPPTARHQQHLQQQQQRMSRSHNSPSGPPCKYQSVQGSHPFCCICLCQCLCTCVLGLADVTSTWCQPVQWDSRRHS
jgi:hypothetical protein